MFGQKSGFGNTNTFGSNTFGNSTFGQNTSQFGAKTPAPTAFGTPTFGSTPIFGNKPASSSTGLFGATSGGFGQPAATSASTFGFGNASITGTGLFGSNQQQTGTNLFGAQSTSAFGAAKPAGFGSFGTSTTANTSLFGQNKQPSLFGSSTSTANTGGLFGAATTSNTGGSLFSTNTASGFGATQQSGTTVKFAPLTGTDTMLKGGVSTNINTKHQCITTMKEYENKSIEELRFEDYGANRKGPQAGSTFGAPQSTGLFGSTPASSASTFDFGNNQNKASFGSTGNSLFGQPQTPSIFGQTSTAGFGTPTTLSSGFGGFGGIKPAGVDMFKSAASTQPSTGLFGQPTTQANTGFGSFGSSGFGTSTQSSIFGTKPAFGTSTTTSAFSFGTNTSNSGAGTSLFGQKPAGSIFSAGATPAFGPTATPSFGGFGSTATTQPSGGLFGNQNKPLGFNSTPSTASFGAGLGSTGFGTSLGGASLGGGSLFGATAAAPKPAFNFGSSFGATNNTFGSTGFGTTASAFGNPISTGLTNENAVQQQVQVQKQLLALSTTPYGDSPLFRNVLTESGKREELLKPTNPAAQKALLSSSQLKVSPMPRAKPKSWNSSINGKKSLFDGLEDEDLGAPVDEIFVPRKSVKKLILKSKQLSPNKQPVDVDTDISASYNTTEVGENNSALSFTPIPEIPSTPVHETPKIESERRQETSPDLIIRKYTTKPNKNSVINSDTSEKIPLDKVRKCPLFVTPVNKNKKDGAICMDDTVLDESANDESQILEPSPEIPCGLILSRLGYYTIPSLKELADLQSIDGKYVVENFTIGRNGYGSVFFPGETDITGLNLDELVHIRRKEIIIYPDEINKPEIGKGLNKKAEVTLDGVWPNDKSTRLPIKSPEQLKQIGYEEKIERSTLKIGAKFLEYRPETGSWLFQVQHFSKYGLEDSDEEEEIKSIPKQQKISSISLKNPVDHSKNLNKGTNDMDLTTINSNRQTNFSMVDSPTSYLNLDMDTTSAASVHVALSKERSSIFLNDDDEMEDITRQTLPQPIDFQIDDDKENEEAYLVSKANILGGSKPQNIQMMKASFFCEEENNLDEFMNDENMNNSIEAEKNTSLHLRGSLLRTKLMRSEVEAVKPSQNIVRNFSEVNSEKVEEYTYPDLISKYPKIPSGLELSHDKPSANMISRLEPAVKIPYSQSVMKGKDRMIADISYFKGNSFRCGWASNSTFIMNGASIPEKIASGPTKFNLMNILTYKVPDHSENMYSVRKETMCWSGQKDLYESSLEIALKHARSSVDGLQSNDSMFPVFAPNLGVDALHDYSEMCHLHENPDPTIYSNIVAQVWNLCVALWGKQSGLDENEKLDSYVNRMVRRKALSDWLISTSNNSTKRDIEKNRNEPDYYLKTLFSHLTVKNVGEACQKAQSFGDHRLALLVSQGGGSTITRVMLQRQLEVWNVTKADSFIDETRLKIFCLLAGVMVWDASDKQINTCEGLDWKRTLALHLWYHCSSTSSLLEAFKEYENAFKGNNPNGKYATSPWPSYVENDSKLLVSMLSADCNKGIHDLCYHLIKLYCKPSHRLNKLLTPTTHFSNGLDHSLSWHLYQVLQSIGFTHLSEHDTDSLHVSYACQLEHDGLWHWAVFVLLHISNEERRKKSVEKVINVHISLQPNDERENFLIEKLNIPSHLIFNSKAMKARSLFKYHDEAQYLLKAGEWNLSHQIILKHIAPDAIIYENLDELENYLVEFENVNACNSVSDWQNGGRLYLDYIHVSKTTSNILAKVSKDEEVSPYELEELQPEVTSLCNRVRNLPTSNAKETLCQSEMAKKTANLLRAVLSLQNKGKEVSTNVLAPSICSLPMPEDYIMQELQSLTQSYMLEVTNS